MSAQICFKNIYLSSLPNLILAFQVLQEDVEGVKCATFSFSWCVFTSTSNYQLETLFCIRLCYHQFDWSNHNLLLWQFVISFLIGHVTKFSFGVLFSSFWLVKSQLCLFCVYFIGLITGAWRSVFISPLSLSIMPQNQKLTMSICNDVMRFSVLWFRSDIRMEL